MAGQRRFPAPWHVDKIPGGHVVRDANGQALAYVYSRDTGGVAVDAARHRFCPKILHQMMKENGTRPPKPRQAKVLTKDEARRIAINIARLPELLGKGEPE